MYFAGQHSNLNSPAAQDFEAFVTGDESLANAVGGISLGGANADGNAASPSTERRSSTNEGAQYRRCGIDVLTLSSSQVMEQVTMSDGPCNTVCEARLFAAV